MQLSALRALLRNLVHPSLLFCVANIFAFAQGGKQTSFLSPAAGVAYLTLAAALVLHLRAQARARTTPVWLNSMLVVAVGALTSGLLSAREGAGLAALCGLFFSAGNFLNAFPVFMRIQMQADAPALLKTLTHAAVYYGLGYACIGLMAGGFATLPTAMTTVLGVATTSLAALGLALKKFTSPAAPFMAVAAGTAINTLSGLLTGNIPGALNNFFAMLGECGLAMMFHQQTDPQLSTDRGGRFWPFVSAALEKPAAFLVKKLG